MSEWLKGLAARRRRVRSLVQSEVNKCGLTCLAMVANSPRHDIDLAYPRALFQLTRIGMSLADIVELADSLGLDAGGHALSNIDELKNAQLPAILHWKGTHFVVLDSVRGGRYQCTIPSSACASAFGASPRTDAASPHWNTVLRDCAGHRGRAPLPTRGQRRSPRRER